VEVSNGVFDAAFLTAHHFFDEVVRCKTISAFLFPRYVFGSARLMRGTNGPLRSAFTQTD
jgi:hypothetical protein